MALHAYYIFTWGREGLGKLERIRTFFYSGGSAWTLFFSFIPNFFFSFSLFQFYSPYWRGGAGVVVTTYLEGYI